MAYRLPIAQRRTCPVFHLFGNCNGNCKMLLTGLSARSRSSGLILIERSVCLCHMSNFFESSLARCETNGVLALRNSNAGLKLLRRWCPLSPPAKPIATVPTYRERTTPSPSKPPQHLADARRLVALREILEGAWKHLAAWEAEAAESSTRRGQGRRRKGKVFNSVEVVDLTGG